jgi:hypothetical protein
MGAIEDIRKVMQDFLAPELRAMDQRLQAIERRLDELNKWMVANLSEFRTDVRERFEKADQRQREMFDKAEQETKTLYQELVVNLSLEARMKRLEEMTMKQIKLKTDKKT